MKKISITSPCLNEVENLRLFYDRCRAALAEFPQYDYEFVLEDNDSSDGSKELLRKIASEDPKFKVIINSNNFGPVRSPYNVLLSATGDAVIWMCADLQEPPEMIGEFLRKWEEGYQVVCATRSDTRASWIFEKMREGFYWTLAHSGGAGHVIRKFTGFGLYDRCFIDALRLYHDPYPYFRGLVTEIGFKRVEVPFVQEARKYGRTKNNIFTLYDQAMTGFVNHTKLPLRLAVFFGFLLACMSFLTALVYLVYKLCNWNSFQLGMAPLVIGLFFFSAVQLIFVGVIGEYIGAIWTQVKNKPLVIEAERINFDK